METLTEHAQGLETTATERHQARMDKTQTEIQSAVAAAIDTIQQAAETQCATQKETLSRYCNEQVESLIADLDNFSGQAHQIQQEILNGVRDGTNEARTVPIEDEEVIEEVIPPPVSRRTKRFPQVDYQAIMSGRNPPSPLPDKATAPSEVPEEKYTNTEYQLLRLRAASTPTQLRSRERKAVIKFYNGFVDFVRQYGVPIKTFDQLHIEHLEDPQMTVYPADMLAAESQVYLRYSAAIYARLEEDGILDPKEPTYSGLLQIGGKESQPPQYTTPVDSTAHPFEFASQLQEFFQCQTNYQRHYTEREQVLMFLQGMQQVRRYALSAAQLVHDLEQQPATGFLAHRLGFLQIPITLDSHPATLPMPSTPDVYAPARLNVTRANADSTSPTARRSNSGNRNRRDGDAVRDTRRGARPTKDVQCPACATYGHELVDCKVLPKLAACLEYIQTHTTTVQNTLQKYRNLNHPNNRQSRQNTREVLANRLYGHLMTQDIPDVHRLVEDITVSLLGNADDEETEDEDDDNSANICHLQAFPDSLSGAPQPVVPCPEADDGQQHTSITVSVSAVQQRDLADTGASVSATGLRNILHDFTTHTRYEITGYDGNVTKAAGEGYALVHNHATATTDRILFVYAPSITGTIFSLEHHAQTHPRIHRWTQEAIPSTQGGWITFYDDRDSIVSRYPTVRSKGVYYIQDMKFVPSLEPDLITDAQQPSTTAPDDTRTILSLHAHESDKLADYTYSGMTETFVDYVQIPMATPIVTSLYHTLSSPTVTSKMEADILNYEVWHQRLAHCSEQKMRKTQQHVDGIPAFRQSTLPSFVRCRACDVATLKKASRGPETAVPRTLHPGQVFHMDLGFFRGPSNLMEVYERHAPPSPKLVESRQGFVCYLLIIDRCTRYLWIFPLRSKSVPPELIRIFLQTHGNPVLEKTAPHILTRQHPPCDIGYLIEDEKTPLPQTPIDTLDPMLAERHHETNPNVAIAAAAFGDLTRPEQQMEEILHAWTDLNSYLPAIPIRLPLNRHPTLGFILVQDTEHPLVYLQGCHMGTKAYRLPRWRSTIRHSVLRTLNGHKVHSIAQVQQLLEDHRQASGQYVDLEFAKVEPRVQPDTDIPHLHFDQLRHINQLHVAMRTEQGLPRDQAFLSLTRSQLKKRNDYDSWRKSEWQQHDKYKAQDMFGPPCPRPRDAIVLPFVWTYMLKEDPMTGEPIFKARGTCNGGKRYGKAVTLAETYATCVEQPACRLYWSLTASAGLIAMGADAGNAFAEAPPPVQPFYMIIDDQFAEWWTESEGNPPIPDGYVLPVQHALQGHPEAPRRRFSVSATDQQACTAIIQAIGAFLKVPLNDLGLIRKFNGVNVMQTRWYIKISCQDYLLKILDNHGWLELKASNQPIPMRHDSAYQRQLELAERPATAQVQQQLQKQVGFSFRAAVGELIYALVIARPEISLSTTKLSQYGTNPASVHYDAVKTIFAFLNNTRDDGLIYWRQCPRMDLPEAPLPTPHSTSANALPTLHTNPTQPIAFSDSDWGSDFSHRRSISGMIIMLSGAAIVYKTRYQKAVALSSTEAEFVSAADTGKMILYVRSLLQDLGFSQPTPTQLHVDNTGAIFMVEAQAPTKRTRHVDIRYFALLDWRSTGQLTAVPIRTDMNLSDSMTKATGRIKFHQHADMFMGRVPPTYVTEAYPAIKPVYIHALAGHKQYPASFLSALKYSPPRNTQYWLAFVSESMGG
ncbi:hypothetical protein MHU86_13400 [Fragilaria crotonensis]|nr:hypothetical protein MHU86_13400 [Fragilaria crotonensis]